MNENADSRYLEDEVAQEDGITYLKFDMKPVNGVVYSIYRDGRSTSETNFKDGKPDGLSRIWNYKGQLIHETNYMNEVQHGKLRRWHEDGRIMYETEFVNGTGVDKLYHDNGQLWSETNFKGGEIDGLNESSIIDDDEDDVAIGIIYGNR